MPARKIILILLPILIALGLFVKFFLIPKFQNPLIIRGIGSVKYYLLEEAKIVAEKNINFFEDWKQPKITTSTTFYDLTGKPSAYLFNVQDILGKSGYLIISATSRYKPVITFSKQYVNPAEKANQLLIELTQNTIWNPHSVKNENIFLGENNFFVKYSFREGDTVDEVYYHLKNDTNSKIDLSTLQDLQKTYEKYQDLGAAEEWAKY